MRDTAKGITLVELMVVLILLSLLALGFSSIYIFAHQNLVVAVRRARLQNELSYIIEHISKNVLGTERRGGAVGNVSVSNQVVRVVSDASGYYLYIRVDSDRDGQLTAADSEISYFADISPSYKVLFSDPDLMITNEVICPNHITLFSITTYTNRNYFDILLRGCWNPLTGGVCGTLDNPQVYMRGRIRMPSVSTN